MLSYRRRSLTGFEKPVTSLKRFVRSIYAKPRMAQSGGYAAQNDYVIVTKDEDFSSRAQATKIGPSVVWLRVGNTSNAVLRDWLIPCVPQVVALIDQGTRLVEVR